MAEPRRYGFFSESRKKERGSVIWLNTEGEEVEITTVSLDPQESGQLLADEVMVGEVVRWVRGSIVIRGLPSLPVTQCTTIRWEEED